MLKNNFGTRYTLDSPTDLNMFSLLPNGSISTIQVSGNPVDGSMVINFISGQSRSGGKLKGVRDYPLSMVKE